MLLPRTTQIFLSRLPLPPQIIRYIRNGGKGSQCLFFVVGSILYPIFLAKGVIAIGDESVLSVGEGIEGLGFGVRGLESGELFVLVFFFYALNPLPQLLIGVEFILQFLILIYF